MLCAKLENTANIKIRASLIFNKGKQNDNEALQCCRHTPGTPAHCKHRKLCFFRIITALWNEFTGGGHGPSPSPNNFWLILPSFALLQSPRCRIVWCSFSRRQRSLERETLLPAASSTTTSLLVGRGSSGEANAWRAAHTHLHLAARSTPSVGRHRDELLRPSQMVHRRRGIPSLLLAPASTSSVSHQR